MKITLIRIDDKVNMEATDEQGHQVQMDASAEQGGNNHGVRPMQMLIMGLGGCTSIDVVMILKKQKQEVGGLRITIDAQKEKNREPSLWEKIHILFELEGKIDPGKANRAVELSMMKYCSVAETLRRAGAAITWEVKVR